MSNKTTCHERNRKIILNIATEYYKNNQERLREQAKNKCRELPDKGNNIKR